MKKETKFRICVMPLIITSAIYFGLYVKDNEFHTWPEYSHSYETDESYYNGEILLPDYVHIDTLQVINAQLLNDVLSNDTTGLIQSDGDIYEVLQEGCVNIADYHDYMNVVTNP